MAVTINSNGTITGIAAGGLPDGVVDADTLADNAVTTAKINADAVTAAKVADDVVNSEHLVDGGVDNAHLATGIASSKLTGALPAISGASLTNLPVSTYTSAAGAGHTGISGNQSVPTTTLTKLTFSHELYDDDSNFDLANERYTAPATGKYWVSCSVGMSTSFGSGQRGILKLYKNGSAAFSPLNDITAECNTSTTSEINATINVVVPLSQNDYLEAMFIHFKGSSQTIGGPKTWLQVYRLS